MSSSPRNSVPSTGGAATDAGALRRADWRFLTGRPAIDALGSDDAVVALSDPSADALQDAYNQLAPGGTCYIEWNKPRVAGFARARRRVEEAGFVTGESYAIWPPPRRAAPLFWIPVSHQAAVEYFLSSRALPTGLRRRAFARATRLAWRAAWRLGALAPVGTLATKRGEGETTPPTLEAELSAQWPTWQLGPVPADISCVLLTGGSSHLNKVVILAFADHEANPRLAIKCSRTPASDNSLHREADALGAIAGSAVAREFDVPALVFTGELAGVFAIGESVVTGEPLQNALDSETYSEIALRVADALRAIVSPSAAVPMESWWPRVVAPVLLGFRERFSPFAEARDIDATVHALRVLPALPLVPEQRDFSPWNVLVGPNGRLAVLDWESAEPQGLPTLDLSYFLANAAILCEGGFGSGRELAAYSKLLDERTGYGHAYADALARYTRDLPIEPAGLHALRAFMWMIHANGEYDRAIAAMPGSTPNPAKTAADASLFFSLWQHDARGDPEPVTPYIVPSPPADLRLHPAPSFSVVIPAYQAADVVGNAIESVFSQTVTPCEIIVCNDGSTDNIEAALAPYRSRIVVINQENGGEAAAKNTGIRAATGEFVAILDADDIFLPTRLEALTELASLRPDLDLLTTDSYLVANGERVRLCFDDTFVFPAHDQATAILRYNFLPFAAVRRREALAAGGFDESLRNVPDWDLWLRMIHSGARAGLVNEPLAEYRLGTTNITSDRARVHRGKLETLEKAYARTDLRDDERRVVEEGMATERRGLALWNARNALRLRQPDARHACIALLRTPGMGLEARVNALAGLAAPRLAGRLLAKRERAGREVTAGIVIPAAPDHTGETR